MWQQIRLVEGQNLARNLGRGVKVAVIDSGIDLAHPAFAGKLAPASEWKDFVDNDNNPQDVTGGPGSGHGTGVAGIILQVAPNATILPIRVLEADGSGDVDDVVAALDWAIKKGAKVINLSLGAMLDIRALKDMTNIAAKNGAYIIASTGNTGDLNVTYPARHSMSGSTESMNIGVGSVTTRDVLSNFSTSGTSVEVVAPGETVYTIVPGQQVGFWSGTSFATPMVSGAMALALGNMTKADSGKLADLVGSTSTNVSGSNSGKTIGKGRLNVQAFITEALK
jgi:thermitase